METTKIEEVMDKTLESAKTALVDCDLGYLDTLACLFGTLFHSYCNIKKLDAEIECLKATASILPLDT